jgi:hypothetical protein
MWLLRAVVTPIRDAAGLVDFRRVGRVGSSALLTALAGDSVRIWCSRAGVGLVRFVRQYLNLIDIWPAVSSADTWARDKTRTPGCGTGFRKVKE